MNRWDVFLWQREWQGRIGSTTMHVVELADHNLVGVSPSFSSRPPADLDSCRIVRHSPPVALATPGFLPFHA